MNSMFSPRLWTHGKAGTTPIDPPDPIAAIQFRMEQQGLTRKDLEPLIGSRARVSEVLTGKRALSIEMVRQGEIRTWHFGRSARRILAVLLDRRDGTLRGARVSQGPEKPCANRPRPLCRSRALVQMQGHFGSLRPYRPRRRPRHNRRAAMALSVHSPNPKDNVVLRDGNRDGVMSIGCRELAFRHGGKLVGEDRAGPVRRREGSPHDLILRARGRVGRLRPTRSPCY